jgi:hypothetical protein
MLTIAGQLIMLLAAVWMLKTWPPKDEAPGWFSAAFCSGLLIFSFAASSLLTQEIELKPMFWFAQLAFYAAFPLLSFVLLAQAFKIDWPKEAWGRILLGVCGIYWVCQQTQSLHYLLAASAVICSLAIAKLLLNKAAGICVKQANLALSVAAFASLVIILHSLAGNPVAAELAAKWPLELALGLLLVAVNRALLLNHKVQPK